MPADRLVREWELFNQPKSKCELDRASGGQLHAYMSSVQGNPYAETLANTTGILWLIDYDGKVFFAQEETYLESNLSLAFIFPRKHLLLPPGLIKLGHPSLLPPGLAHTKLARCAGDITYDPDLNADLPWIIRFASGRYAAHRSHLTLGMLQTVAERFEDCGVYVAPIHDTL